VNYKEPFTLQTDACDISIAEILTQFIGSKEHFER
jgi:hypothetical protein